MFFFLLFVLKNNSEFSNIMKYATKTCDNIRYLPRFALYIFMKCNFLRGFNDTVPRKKLILEHLNNTTKV